MWYTRAGADLPSQRSSPALEGTSAATPMSPFRPLSTEDAARVHERILQDHPHQPSVGSAGDMASYSGNRLMLPDGRMSGPVNFHGGALLHTMLGELGDDALFRHTEHHILQSGVVRLKTDSMRRRALVDIRGPVARDQHAAIYQYVLACERAGFTVSFETHDPQTSQRRQFDDWDKLRASPQYTELRLLAERAHGPQALRATAAECLVAALRCAAKRLRPLYNSSRRGE